MFKPQYDWIATEKMKNGEPIIELRHSFPGKTVGCQILMVITAEHICISMNSTAQMTDRDACKMYLESAGAQFYLKTKLGAPL